MEMGERKIIARRAALELKANSVVNLGIGMPEGIASVAAEEQRHRPGDADRRARRDRRHAGRRPQLRRRDQRAGDHRPALPVRLLRRRRARPRVPRPRPGRPRRATSTSRKFGPRLAGAGGFINISQNAKTVVFVGTFTAGRLEVEVEDGRLAIVREGTSRKFVAEVEHRTFCGRLRAASAASPCSTSPSAACSG